MVACLDASRGAIGGHYPKALYLWLVFWKICVYNYHIEECCECPGIKYNAQIRKSSSSAKKHLYYKYNLATFWVRPSGRKASNSARDSTREIGEVFSQPASLHLSSIAHPILCTISHSCPTIIFHVFST